MAGKLPGGLGLRRACPADAAAIAAMSARFRAALGEPPDHLTEAAVLRDGFGPDPEFEVILAEVDGDIAGYALFLNGYEPTYAARGLYLADLYIEVHWRRRGIARAMVAAVAAESRRRGRTFVWWVTLANNTEAQAFYRTLGVVAVPMLAHAATPFDGFEALADEALPVAG